MKRRIVTTQPTLIDGETIVAGVELGVAGDGEPKIDRALITPTLTLRRTGELVTRGEIQARLLYGAAAVEAEATGAASNPATPAPPKTGTQPRPRAPRGGKTK